MKSPTRRPAARRDGRGGQSILAWERILAFGLEEQSVAYENSSPKRDAVTRVPETTAEDLRLRLEAGSPDDPDV